MLEVWVAGFTTDSRGGTPGKEETCDKRRRTDDGGGGEDVVDMYHKYWSGWTCSSSQAH